MEILSKNSASHSNCIRQATGIQRVTPVQKGASVDSYLFASKLKELPPKTDIVEDIISEEINSNFAAPYFTNSNVKKPKSYSIKEIDRKYRSVERISLSPNKLIGNA